VTTAPAAVDRRQRRRLETIEEVVDVAAEVVAEQGAAGLSIGEVARRMGIKPPSLYGYFESKNAIYDALFARGAQQVLEVMRPVMRAAADEQSLETALLTSGRTMIRWSIEHPAYAQLIFWRPVPGFEPSPAAYAPAIALMDESRQSFTVLQERGLIRSDISVDVILRNWTILVSGITTQQLSNAPDEPFDTGTFTSALPDIVAMFATRYAAPPAGRQPASTTRKVRRADKR